MTQQDREQEVVVQDVDEDLGTTVFDGDEIPDELDTEDLDEIVDGVQDFNISPIVGADDGAE